MSGQFFDVLRKDGTLAYVARVLVESEHSVIIALAIVRGQTKEFGTRYGFKPGRVPGFSERLIKVVPKEEWGVAVASRRVVPHVVET